MRNCQVEVERIEYAKVPYTNSNFSSLKITLGFDLTLIEVWGIRITFDITIIVDTQFISHQLKYWEFT
jgi:hypothetical protein